VRERNECRHDMMKAEEPTRMSETMLATIARLLPAVIPGDLASMSVRGIEAKAQGQARQEYKVDAPQCDSKNGPLFSPFCILETQAHLAYIWTHVDVRGNITGPSPSLHNDYRFDGMELFLLYYCEASRQFRFTRKCEMHYRLSEYARRVEAGDINESHCLVCDKRHPTGQYDCYIGNCPYGFHICRWCPPGLDNDHSPCDCCFPCEDPACPGFNYSHCCNSCEVLCALKDAGHPLSLGMESRHIPPPTSHTVDDVHGVSGLVTCSMDEERKDSA
jgi:hypothetical protein